MGIPYLMPRKTSSSDRLLPVSCWATFPASMTLMTVYLVPEAGPVQALAELPNALGGAAFVWSVIGARHLPGKPWHTWTDQEWRHLSSLLATDHLSFTEKAVFCATLDYAVIERACYGQMSRALRPIQKARSGLLQCRQKTGNSVATL